MLNGKNIMINLDDENGLYICQTDMYGNVKPMSVIGLVEWEGKLIVLDTKTALCLEDNLGSKAYDKLPFIGVSKFYDYLKSLELN